MALVAIGGFFLQSTLPVNVTFGQALAPVSAATVSSLMMGFAWGSGGLSVPFVGMVADRIGIEATLRGLALVPLAAAALALPLPRTPAGACADAARGGPALIESTWYDSFFLRRSTLDVALRSSTRRASTTRSDRGRSPPPSSG